MVARAIMLTLTASELFIGVWADVLPRSFHDQFPGGPFHWLPPLGPFNEHLTRDFGGLSLALAAVTFIAVLRPIPLAAVTMAVAWELYSVPHLIFHLGHTAPFAIVDNVLTVASLSATVALPLVAVGLVLAIRPEAGARSAPR